MQTRKLGYMIVGNLGDLWKNVEVMFSETPIDLIYLQLRLSYDYIRALRGFYLSPMSPPRVV
jgi:hypothetical protein